MKLFTYRQAGDNFLKKYRNILKHGAVYMYIGFRGSKSLLVFVLMPARKQEHDGHPDFIDGLFLCSVERSVEGLNDSHIF